LRIALGVVLLAAFMAGRNGMGRTVDLIPLWDESRVLRNPHKGWFRHFYAFTPVRVGK
jgi:hypothetical protein